MQLPNPSKQKKSKKLLLVIIAALGIAAIIGFVLWRQLQLASPATTQQQDFQTSTANSSGPVVDETTNSDESIVIDSSITPATPSGVFVSNHRPNLSGNPAPNTITSTCSTTPQAKCTIRFTSGSSIKTLPSQIVGTDGNAEWTWTLQEIGLSVGEWDVTAIASNGDKTSTSSDSMKLVVSE